MKKKKMNFSADSAVTVAKRILILSAAIFIIVTAVVLLKTTSLADSAINSSGNFILQDESEMAIYQEDFLYLKNELGDLFDELSNQTENISEEQEDEGL